MKVLLIGPHPPPHGGISVHVAGIYQYLTAAGVTCHVLDTSHVRPGVGFALVVLRHALKGWTLHLHTNGHNLKSWLLALGCGLAGQSRGGCILTLHSGMLPGYLDAAPWRRNLAAFACSYYSQVVCVSPAIRGALLPLGVEPRRTVVLPAFLGTEGSSDRSKSGPRAWIARHWPLFSTVLFFRPEYGFNLLIAGLAQIRRRYPSLGCLVMGSGEQRTEAEKMVRDTGLEEGVRLLGDVNHEACLTLMSASDVFLRPTLQDGDSVSVREALSLGVPVVASRTGTRPAGALLFAPGDVKEMIAAIERAIAGKAVGQPPRSAGCMDRLMELYRQVDGSEGTMCFN